MQIMKAQLAVPHQYATREPKRVFFGQLLVETGYDRLTFAKEAANAVITQAELNRVQLEFTPNGDRFVTRIERGEHVLEFTGDLPGYLRIPAEDANSMHVSFREADESDRRPFIERRTKISPDYVLTISAVAMQAGELGDRGFWIQLATNLFQGIYYPDEERERPGDAGLKISIIYGDSDSQRIVRLTSDDKR